MITAIVQVECYGVASRKTGNNAHPDPAQHTTDPWSNTKMGLTRQTAIGPGISEHRIL